MPRASTSYPRSRRRTSSNPVEVIGSDAVTSNLDWIRQGNVQIADVGEPDIWAGLGRARRGRARHAGPAEPSTSRFRCACSSPTILRALRTTRTQLFGGDFVAQYAQALGPEIAYGARAGYVRAATAARLFELRGLTKEFRGHSRVLSSVDLAVRAGEVHALIGQNGSGKSTLIKILSGYHAPDAGEISLRGERSRCRSSPASPRASACVSCIRTSASRGP